MKNSADIRICIKHYGCLWNFCFGPIPNRRDLGYEIGSRLTRNRSREVWLKGEIGRNWLRSNAPGNDCTADRFLLGSRPQGYRAYADRFARFALLARAPNVRP